MNNTIEFVLRMRDMMSANLAKVSSTSQSTFTKMSQSAEGMTGKNKVLGMSFNELQTKIRQVESTISNSTIPSQIAAARRELASLQRLSTNHAGNTATSGGGGGGVGLGAIAGGTLLGNVATAGIAAAGSALGSIFSGSMKKELDIAGISTFLGKQAANDTYKNIQKDAQATPFDTASLLQVNRSLISAGASARDARTDTLNLANSVVAVGGSNDTLVRMAANMQQIKNVGKASAEDVKQFGYAGINIYQLLARSTGKSIDQVKEMKVTYDDLSKALAMAAGKGGIYENALENAANTQATKWSNIKETITIQLTNIGDAFAPLTSKVLDLGAQFAKAGDYIVQFATWLTSGATSAGIFTAVIGGLATGFLAYQAVITAVQIKTWLLAAETWKLNAALTANPIGITVIAIAALVAGVVIAYQKFEKFRAVVDGVWGVLKEVGRLIKSILLGDLSGIASSLKKIFSGQSFTNAHNISINESAAARHQRIKDKATQAAKDKAFDADKAKASALGTGGAAMAANTASGKTAGQTVAGAGPKVTNITVGKFFDNLQFTTLNAGESATEIEKIVMECFARVVYNGAKTAG